MMNRFVGKYLLLLCFPWIMCSGCAILRFPQYAAVSASNAAFKPCSQTVYSNMLWSKDNKKIYFITQTIYGHYKKIVSSAAKVDPVYNDLGLGIPGLVNSVIEPRVDTYEICDPVKPSLCQLYSVDVESDAFVLTPVFSFTLETDDKLSYTCMFWTSEEEIGDDNGHIINIQTGIFNAPPPNVEFKRIISDNLTYWVGYGKDQKEHMRLPVREYLNMSYALNNGFPPYFERISSHFDFNVRDLDYGEFYNFELKKFAFRAIGSDVRYIGIVDFDGRNLKYIKIE